MYYDGPRPFVTVIGSKAFAARQIADSAIGSSSAPKCLRDAAAAMHRGPFLHLPPDCHPHVVAMDAEGAKQATPMAFLSDVLVAAVDPRTASGASMLCGLCLSALSAASQRGHGLHLVVLEIGAAAAADGLAANDQLPTEKDETEGSAAADHAPASAEWARSVRLVTRTCAQSNGAVQVTRVAIPRSTCQQLPTSNGENNGVIALPDRAASSFPAEAIDAVRTAVQKAHNTLRGAHVRADEPLRFVVFEDLPRVGVWVVRIVAGTLRVGDALVLADNPMSTHVAAASLRTYPENVPLSHAGPGQLVGIRVLAVTQDAPPVKARRYAVGGRAVLGELPKSSALWFLRGSKTPAPEIDPDDPKITVRNLRLLTFGGLSEARCLAAGRDPQGRVTLVVQVIPEAVHTAVMFPVDPDTGNVIDDPENPGRIPPMVLLSRGGFQSPSDDTTPLRTAAFRVLAVRPRLALHERLGLLWRDLRRVSPGDIGRKQAIAQLVAQWRQGGGGTLTAPAPTATDRDVAEPACFESAATAVRQALRVESVNEFAFVVHGQLANVLRGEAQDWGRLIATGRPRAQPVPISLLALFTRLHPQSETFVNACVGFAVTLYRELPENAKLPGTEYLPCWARNIGRKDLTRPLGKLLARFPGLDRAYDSPKIELTVPFELAATSQKAAQWLNAALVAVDKSLNTPSSMSLFAPATRPRDVLTVVAISAADADLQRDVPGVRRLLVSESFPSALLLGTLRRFVDASGKRFGQPINGDSLYRPADAPVWSSTVVRTLYRWLMLPDPRGSDVNPALANLSGITRTMGLDVVLERYLFTCAMHKRHRDLPKQVVRFITEFAWGHF
jgi:hypothetical protein